MTGELKPPKTIYLQWDADPLAENTWSEDRINDDDVEYTRSDMGKPAEIIALKSLIERLVEAGDKVAHYSNFEDFDINGIDEWDTLIAEWEASKDGGVE